MKYVFILSKKSYHSRIFKLEQHQDKLETGEASDDEEDAEYARSASIGVQDWDSDEEDMNDFLDQNIKLYSSRINDIDELKTLKETIVEISHHQKDLY